MRNYLQTIFDHFYQSDCYLESFNHIKSKVWMNDSYLTEVYFQIDVKNGFGELESIVRVSIV